ncbi:hypothetical protein L207DRAFT_525590 [Hyaloscypha variabilis F]|uniref:Pal1-domain-containing protein n=1 Tax=Hyaloscypha variabilis (strain UAMH 11265 / GT02V1 / F) TaxID=1149755 RepID=A0A2J6S0E6_HYAVF|nr:hypothetical protein L207DRAFT_525590 [Hyaloscypha variabilis F]
MNPFSYGKKKKPLLPSFSGSKDGGSKAKDTSKDEKIVMAVETFECINTPLSSSFLDLGENDKPVQSGPAYTPFYFAKHISFCAIFRSCLMILLYGPMLTLLSATESLVETPVLAASSRGGNIHEEHTEELLDKPLPLANKNPLSRMRRNWTVADFSPYASTDKVHDDEVSSISALHKADSGEDLIPQIPQRSSKRPSQKPKPDSDSQIEALTISSPTPGPENYLPPAQYESQEQIIQRINEANEQFRRSKASQTPSSNTNSGRGARQGRGSLGKAVDKFKNVFTNHRIGSNGKSHHECNNRDSSDLHGSEDMNSMRKVDDLEKAKEIKPKYERRIHRKPVADGGKSLMSTNSNFYKVIPPTGHGYLSEDGGIEGEPTIPSLVSKKSQPGMPKQTHSVGDLDTSSSPQGQSTRVLGREAYGDNDSLTGIGVSEVFEFDPRPGFPPRSNLSHMAADDKQIGVAITTDDAAKRDGSCAQELRLPVERTKPLLTKKTFSNDEAGQSMMPTASGFLSSKDVNWAVESEKGPMPGTAASPLKFAMGKPAVGRNHQSEPTHNEDNTDELQQH